MRNWPLIFRRAMPVLDFILVILAFRLAYILRYDLEFLLPRDELFATSLFQAFIPWAMLFAGWLILTRPVSGLYREQRGRAWLEEVYGIINGVTNATVIV